MQIGDVHLDYLGHDGFLIRYKGKKIAIDPYHVSIQEKVDVILITHEHHDHCSLEDIRKLAGAGTIVTGPAHVHSTVMRVEGVRVEPIEVGDQVEVEGVKVEAVPAYCVNKYKDPDKKIVYHPQSEGYVGYVLKFGNIVIYHAGDTDFIPEMRHLSGYGKQGNQFIALLPISGKYVMTVEEAVEAADVLHPTLAIPMHYGPVVGTLEDAHRFVSLCRERGINAEVLEKL